MEWPCWDCITGQWWITNSGAKVRLCIRCMAEIQPAKRRWKKA